MLSDRGSARIENFGKSESSMGSHPHNYHRGKNGVRFFHAFASSIASTARDGEGVTHDMSNDRAIEFRRRHTLRAHRATQPLLKQWWSEPPQFLAQYLHHTKRKQLAPSIGLSSDFYPIKFRTLRAACIG